MSATHTAPATPALLGLARLMTMAFQGRDLTAIGQQLIQRSEANDANALLDLSTLLQLRGDKTTGLAVHHEALKLQKQFRLIPEVQKTTLKVLAFMAPGDLMTNTPLEFIGDGGGFQLELLYVSPELGLPKNIPEHDIAIVALSELDRNMNTLAMLKPFLKQWPKPVLNMPQAIEVLGRDLISNRFQKNQRIDMPLTLATPQEQLAQLALGEIELKDLLADAHWPIIVRPMDSHAGIGLEKINGPEALAAYLYKNHSPEYFIARFVDYRSADGQFRKYRIMLIDGEPHLAHMAISDHWMVHYLNAGMVESATKRQEEARTMVAFDEIFARKHRQALQDIHRTTGMDYLGMDCGESQDGRLLVFEIGASMNVHAMDPVDIFPYKQPQMQRLFAEFVNMLWRKHITARIDRRAQAAPQRQELDVASIAV